MIKLVSIIKKDCSIQYQFETSDKLACYFTDKPFVVEYPESIMSVPDAVLAVTFVCSVLPIVWLTNAELIIPELDMDFYNSIPIFEKGYIDMYPDAEFLGKITVNNIVNCRKEGQKGAVAFFSGGLDATTTLLRHLDEKPDLLSILGSDIGYDNEQGWKPIQNAIDEISKEYNLKHINIRSSFRLFDEEDELDKQFSDKLHDGWWHGVKNGIGLIGHSAPYVWLHSKKVVYIASSYCKADGKVTCASDSTIDNYVKFCGVNVVHDGYELGRQEKARYLVEYRRNNPTKKISMHVCWESVDGHNCCACEKCYRTMMAIWIEGDNPKNYGFEYSPKILKKIYIKMAFDYSYAEQVAKFWERIKEAMIKNHKMLIKKDYYKDIKWIEKYDFFDASNSLVLKRKIWRLRTKTKNRLMDMYVYRILYEIKKCLTKK